MIESVELHPVDGRKSFYRKAVALYHEPPHCWMLKSYDTIVASYRLGSDRFTKLWDGYSATTMRHINSFLCFLGHEPKNKVWWMDLPMFSGVIVED